LLVVPTIAGTNGRNITVARATTRSVAATAMT
jgi:hypothetical protein